MVSDRFTGRPRRLFWRPRVADVLFRREDPGVLGGTDGGYDFLPIVLRVRPSVDGRTGLKVAARFDGFIGDREVVTRSRTPLCAAARVLIGEGVSPELWIEMRHDGSSVVALRATVGTAAKLTVKDRDNGRPGFARYREGVPEAD